MNKVKIGGYSIVVLVLVMVAIRAISQDRVEDLVLVWEDDFLQEELDETYWTVITGDGCPALCGWGNNEAQYYTDYPENVRIENGKLIIEAHRQKIENYKYSSAKLVTKNKVDCKFGRIEMKAKIPVGRGTWSAFWMLPSVDRPLEWPLDGEIDIVEHVGHDQGRVHGTIHTEKYNGMIGTQKTNTVMVEKVHQDFHTYAIDWDEDEIKWYVDGTMYGRLQKKRNESKTGWPFNQYDYHLILNLAIGGNWGGKEGIDTTAFPQRVEVDYVRYLIHK